MAPEQALGLKVDHRADLFSLGTVLYQMCSGELPFHGASTTVTLRNVCEAAPRPLRDFNPAAPIWLVELICRLHAKDPESRLSSAAEVSAALAGRQAVSPTAIGHGGAAETSRTDPRHGRGRSGLIFAIVMGLVFALSLTAWCFLRLPAPGAAKPFSTEAQGPAPEPVGTAAPWPEKNTAGSGDLEAGPQASPPPNVAKPPPVVAAIAAPRTADMEQKSAAEETGVVEVKADDAVSAGFLSGRGLDVRLRRTSHGYRLRKGRTEMPPGEYEVNSDNFPAWIFVPVRRFTVEEGDVTTVLVQHKTPPSETPPPAPADAPPFQPPPPPPPPGRPPLPPRFGGN